MRKVIRGLARHARIHGLGTTLRPQRPPKRRDLNDFGAVGVVTAITTMEIWQRVKALRLPTVNVSTWLTDLPTASACPDNPAIGRMAAKFFMDKKFQSFAFYAGSEQQYVIDRRAAFVDVLTQADISCWRIPRTGYGRNWRDQARKLSNALRDAPKPLAVFCATDEDGRHFVEICRRGEIRVPEEVAVLGVDDDRMLCEISTPPLSSIDTRAEKIGYEAGSLLVRLMDGEADPDERITLAPAGVVERRSTDVIAVTDADIAAVLHHIRENVDRPMRVQDLVARSNLSRRTMERRFVAAVGHSPAEEIRRQHIRRACHLLSFTDWNMTRVAYGSGFRSFRHLAEVFRRELHLSPTAYRKQTHSLGVADTD